MAAAVAAAPRWLPDCKYVELIQVLNCCIALQYRDETFMQACLQRGLQLLGQQQPNRQGRSNRPLLAAERDKVVGICCLSVATLDLRSLAGPACELVSRSGIGQRVSAHKANLSKLWVFHSWLLQHQLLDGKGLTGMLMQQQLQQGAKDVAMGLI